VNHWALNKPLIILIRSLVGWFFNWIKYAIDRDRYFENNFGKPALSIFNELPHNKKVLLIGDVSWIFPFLIRRPDLDITVGNKNRLSYGNKLYNIDNRTDYEFIKSKYDYMIFMQVKPVRFLELKRLIPGQENLRRDIVSFYDLDPNMAGND
jgi:hypothetical protein